MCSTHLNGQDGGCGPRGSGVCKGSHVFKVTFAIQLIALQLIGALNTCTFQAFLQLGQSDPIDLFMSHLLVIPDIL